MAKESLGIIGIGAFGAFMAQHLAPHFDLILHDQRRNLAPLAKKYRASVGGLSEVAGCKIIVLAVPVQRLKPVLLKMEKLVKRDALVIDVSSVKIKPVEMMKKILPKSVAIVGTHPLFGPQSGKNGIKGLNIVVCNGRGGRATCVRRFCRDKLGLRVFEATPQEHDKELAYVQGLTHLLAKVVVSLGLPPFRFTTRTYDLMAQMIEMVRYDSDELFKAIERENPFTAQAKKEFFAAARKLEKKLSRG